MRASDQLKGSNESSERTHDNLCLIAERFIVSPSGRIRLGDLFLGGAMQAANPVSDTSDSWVSVEPVDWEYPIVRQDSPAQFGLKGYCDLSAVFLCLLDGKEYESRLFVECKPRVNVGEAIRQLKFYRHHYQEQCSLVLATFEQCDEYAGAFLGANIDVWVFVQHSNGHGDIFPESDYV
jgi:hypothetical protein